ncbi:hypothetical protein DB30_03905 [Enhygromyxa salina]|uniref:HTTM domain-containing protein n=1 Tax=Enhygromyxa salina TaxID=215803 RepID=A0A0C1ZP63_9BACT|nr:HTTM domain-containing protein [Enhygromyxa salina]KIG19349.1 hypothetical protein DB30_03905 [Enhygromyxa salina]
MSDAQANSFSSRLARLFGAEVSSRSLGLLRVLIVTTVLFRLVSPWVSHRMDDNVGVLLASQLMFYSSFFVLVGYKTRIATAVMASTFGILHLHYGFSGEPGLEKLTEPTVFFQAVVLLALTPCGRSLSVDRVLETRRARREGRRPAPERMPAWLLELFVFQTSAIYLWGAYDMAEPGWLSGMRLELYFLDHYGSSDSFVHLPKLENVAVVGAWFGLISCVVIGVGLLVRPTRAYVAGFALILQCVVLWTYTINWAGSYFNLMMVNMLLVCVPPQRIHTLVTTVIKGPAAADAELGARGAMPRTASLGLFAEGSVAETCSTPANTTDPSTNRSLAARPWMGPLALGVALLCFHLPPYRAQVQERERAPLVWDWQLHGTARRPVCDLRFHDMNQAGAVIERWRLLGHARPRDLPDKQARVYPHKIRAASRDVCKALRERGDDPPRVELFARCPVDREWNQVAAREHDICATTKSTKHGSSKP